VLPANRRGSVASSSLPGVATLHRLNRSFSSRAQAQQIFLQQEAAAERAKSSEFGREQAKAQRSLQGRQQERLEQGQKFSQDLAERQLAQRGELGRRRLDIAGRPKAVKPTRTLPKQPSKTPDFFINALEGISPNTKQALTIKDEEGNFVNQQVRNEFLDALDVFSSRNPQGTDDDAIRFALKSSGINIPPAKQVGGVTAPTAAPVTGTAAPALGLRRPQAATPALAAAAPAQQPAQAAPRTLSRNMQRRVDRLEQTIEKAKRRGNPSIVRSLTATRDKIIKRATEPKRRRQISARPKVEREADFDPAGKVGRQTPRQLIGTGRLEEGTAEIRQETDEERGVRELFSEEEPKPKQAEEPRRRLGAPVAAAPIAAPTVAPVEEEPVETPVERPRIAAPAAATGPRIVGGSAGFPGARGIPGTDIGGYQPGGLRQLGKSLRSLLALDAPAAQTQEVVGDRWLPDRPQVIELGDDDPEPPLPPGPAGRREIGLLTDPKRIAEINRAQAQKKSAERLRDILPFTSVGHATVAADAVTGGPAQRVRGRNIAIMSNASEALRAGNLPARDARNTRILISEANNLSQREDLGDAEQARLDEIIKVLKTRFSK